MRRKWFISGAITVALLTIVDGTSSGSRSRSGSASQKTTAWKPQSFLRDISKGASGTNANANDAASVTSDENIIIPPSRWFRGGDGSVTEGMEGSVCTSTSTSGDQPPQLTSSTISMEDSQNSGEESQPQPQSQQHHFSPTHSTITSSTSTTPTTATSSSSPHNGYGQQGGGLHRHPFHKRHLTRSDERAILGRAVLTTPHRRMPAIRIAPGPRPSFLTPQNPGPSFSSTPIYVTKSTLCQTLHCALRDLRVIDQFSSTTGGSISGSSISGYAGPAFLARKNCVIVNVGHLRAIVMRDEVLIFIPWEQQQQQQQHQKQGLNSIDGNSGSTNNTNNNHDNVMQTINDLVEALVIHLNSIYHSGNRFNLIIEDSVLSPNETAKGHQGFGLYDKGMMGQPWGSPSGLQQQDQQRQRQGGDKKIQKRRRNKLQRRLRRNKKNSNNSDISSNNNVAPVTQPTAKAPPFELVVIEALLGHVCSHESTKASHLINAAQEVLSGITYTDHDHNHDQKQKHKSSKKKDAFLEMQRKLGELLPLKNRVDELEAKCSEVASAIAEVLKNDEDMAAMRLSEIAALRKSTSSSSSSSSSSKFATSVDELLLDEGDPYNLHVEVELLFEDYLLQMDEVLHSLRSVQSSITNTEEVVEIELDLLRNRIMRYEMLLELSGLVVGVAAAVTGAFGMNLVNHFEEHPRMFYEVSLGLVIFMGVMGYAILNRLSRDSIL